METIIHAMLKLVLIMETIITRNVKISPYNGDDNYTQC